MYPWDSYFFSVFIDKVSLIVDGRTSRSSSDKVCKMEHSILASVILRNLLAAYFTSNN